MDPTPQTTSTATSTATSTTTTAARQPWRAHAVTLAFREYQFVAEDTAKISDRRQTVNTLFVSINALFLTGVGYLLLQFLQNTRQQFIVYATGFLAIAIITTNINRAWLRLGNQYSQLVNLRIRYLKQLEQHMREAEHHLYPKVETPLKPDEVHVPGVAVERTRGMYSLEDVLYASHNKRAPFGFTDAEKRIGRTFTWAYWVAFIAVLIFAAINFANVHINLGPIHF